MPKITKITHEIIRSNACPTNEKNPKISVKNRKNPEISGVKNGNMAVKVSLKFYLKGRSEFS